MKKSMKNLFTMLQAVIFVPTYAILVHIPFGSVIRKFKPDLITPQELWEDVTWEAYHPEVEEA